MTGEPDDPGLFRKKSLERLSSPERLDQLLEVVDRKTWIPLAAAGSIVLALVLWAVFGKVPIRVEGRGILVRPRQIVELQSAGPGRVERLNVEVGDAVQAGVVLAAIERPDLREQLRLQREKLAQLRAESRPAGSGPADAIRPAGTPPASLHDHIETTRAYAVELRNERLAALEEERKHLDVQEAKARDLTAALTERLASRREMLEEGYVAQVEIDVAKRQLVDALERLHEVETQQGALPTARLEAEEQYFDRMQTIAEWTFQLGQQIAEVEREISRLDAQLLEESRIVSDRDGRIIELSASAGTFLGAGDRLGAMEITDPQRSLESVSYFRVRDGKRLDVGDEIQVTPDTVERERFGSIRGVVRYVSKFPVSLEQATTVVGNRIVAQSLIDAGYLIEVTAELEILSQEPLRYAWTSSRGPEGVEVTAGTTTSARVAVESVRPIALVIPLLKSTAGLD